MIRICFKQSNKSGFKHPTPSEFLFQFLSSLTMISWCEECCVLAGQIVMLTLKIILINVHPLNRNDFIQLSIDPDMSWSKLNSENSYKTENEHWNNRNASQASHGDLMLGDEESDEELLILGVLLTKHGSLHHNFLRLHNPTLCYHSSSAPVSHWLRLLNSDEQLLIIGQLWKIQVDFSWQTTKIFVSFHN